MDYPPELSPASVTEIEQVLAETERAYPDAGAPQYSVFWLGSRTSSDPEPPNRPSTIDPVEMVLHVYRVVVDVSLRQAHEWSAQTLRSVADRVLAALLDRIYSRYAARSRTREAFTNSVYQTVHADACYASLLDAIRDRSLAPAPTVSKATPAPSPQVDTRDMLTIEQVAKRLKVSVDKVERMGKDGRIKILDLGPRTKRIKPAELDRLMETDEFKYPNRR